jgi:hypothetical protein
MFRSLLGMLVIFMTACASQKKKPIDTQQSDSAPRLKKPEVRRVWVPDQIVGDEFVAGHFKYVIQKNAAWAKED